MMERNDEMPPGSERLDRSARRIEMGARMTLADVEALQREVQAEKEARQQLAAKLQQAEMQNQVLHDRLAATSERAREEAQAAQQRVDALRQDLKQAEADRQDAIQRGVNYNLAQRQVELDRLERDIQHAEKNLASFRQKLREISSAEYENQRLNLDAEKVLREIVLFGTTLNLYECEEIFPVNWGLLDQIVLGAESLAALIGDFKAARRLTEKPVSAG